MHYRDSKRDALSCGELEAKFPILPGALAPRSIHTGPDGKRRGEAMKEGIRSMLIRDGTVHSLPDLAISCRGGGRSIVEGTVG